MRPRNDYEREADRLQGELRPLSFAQIRWMVVRNRESLETEFEREKKRLSLCYYYAVVTRCHGWQVVRYFVLHSTISKKNGYDLDYIVEISQRWMKWDGQGQFRLVIFERQKAMCWQWKSQPYCLSAPLSIKDWDTGWNRGGRSYFSLYDEDIYPIRRHTEEFADKGLYPLLGGTDEIEMYKYITNHSNGGRQRKTRQRKEVRKKPAKRYDLPVRLETLMKLGDKELVAEYIKGKGGVIRSGIDKYWRPFILARRHGVRLGGLTWKDWFEYVKDLDYLGLDIHSPHYLCPANLAEAHTRMLARAERKRNALRKAEIKKECAKYEGDYRKNMGRYFGLLITSKHLTIMPIRSVAEMREEGERMHHCVYSAGYYRRFDSLILSARDCTGKRQETIEVSLRDFTVVQSRALQNGVSKYHKEIESAMKKNMNQIKEIACAS